MPGCSLRVKGNVELRGVGIRDGGNADDGDRPPRPGEADDGARREGRGVHRYAEVHPYVVKNARLEIANVAGVGDARPRDAERGRVLVAWNFTVNQVAVLVHLVAEQVADVRSQDHRVGACRCLRPEINVEWGEVGARDREDAVNADRPSWPAEAGDLGWREGGHVDRLAEGDPHSVHRLAGVGDRGR
jgi:hypothetical protein